MPIAKIDDKGFQKQVLECPLPVIVVFEKNFWGTSCIMKPIIEEIAKEYDDKIIIFKYNLEENSIIANNYRVENSTTILIFHKANVIYKTGVISKRELTNLINSLFSDYLKMKQLDK